MDMHITIYKEKSTWNNPKEKTYQVSMQAVDNAGNTTEANNEIKTITVESLPETQDHVTVEHSTKEPTKRQCNINFQKKMKQ